jgi:hypothetical protein
MAVPRPVCGRFPTYDGILFIQMEGNMFPVKSLASGLAKRDYGMTWSSREDSFEGLRSTKSTLVED